MLRPPLLVSPDVLKEFARLGNKDVLKCYQCGSCTAVCPISEDRTVRVRRYIKAVQLGIKSKVLGDPTPWLCYFCGDCVESCPKDATPGMVMDTARKYQMINYSVGRISRLFMSKVGAALSLLIMTVIGVLGILLSRGDARFDTVDLNSFMPAHTLHDLGMLLFAYFAIVIVIQVTRMYGFARAAIGKGANPPLSRWFSSLGEVIGEFLFQPRLVCDGGEKQFRRYLAHISLVWGFLLLLIATNVHFILNYTLQMNVPVAVPRTIGIVGGVLALAGSIFFVLKRREGRDVFARISDAFDWWLLFVVVGSLVSGFLTTIFAYFNSPALAYFSYAAHLLFVFYLLASLPFTKLMHLVYRPLAIWFARVWEG